MVAVSMDWEHVGKLAPHKPQHTTPQRTNLKHHICRTPSRIQLTRVGLIRTLSIQTPTVFMPTTRAPTNPWLGESLDEKKSLPKQQSSCCSLRKIVTRFPSIKHQPFSNSASTTVKGIRNLAGSYVTATRLSGNRGPSALAESVFLCGQKKKTSSRLLNF